MKECLDYYHDRAFVKMDGTFDTRPVPILVSKVIAKTDIKILPFYYFSPIIHIYYHICTPFALFIDLRASKGSYP